MHRVTVHAGDVIYRQGEASASAYMILSGEIGMERGDITIPSGPGELIGFSVLFDRPYGSTATALGDATLLAFSRKELRTLIRTDPYEAIKIVEAIIAVLGRVSEELERRNPSGSPGPPAGG